MLIEITEAGKANSRQLLDAIANIPFDKISEANKRRNNGGANNGGNGGQGSFWEDKAGNGGTNSGGNNGFVQPGFNFGFNDVLWNVQKVQVLL